MARLANETGGRVTERTNDLTLAYARAQRDLGCVYSVGFYIEEGQEDEAQSVTVRVKRKGLRAVHPGKYLFRSPTSKQQSLLTAAWAAPEMFQSGVVRGHVFPLRPSSGETWDALMAVSFPVPLEDAAGGNAHRDFGVILNDGARVVHRFDRRITLEPDSAEVTSTPLITFLEHVDLKPGRYTLTAVLADPKAVEPHAYKFQITIPEVPSNELFLMNPVLGRASGGNLVVIGSNTKDAGGDRVGEANSFEPLLIQQVEEAVDLISLTQVCFLGSKRQEKKALAAFPAIRRKLVDTEGVVLGELQPVETRLETEGKIHCQNLVDVLPTRSLSNGDYVFEAKLPGEAGGDATETVRFSIRR